ncbi:MAG: ABC transporter permease [Spartobacteria bacterium]|nr:ABC transporter permease [Spartobacteria bacterium]
MIQMQSRTRCPGWQSFAFRMIGVLGALLVTSAFMRLMGHNPLSVYWAIIEGALGSPYRVKETVIEATPLLLCSLGIAVAFKMKFWNIGAEGQLLVGGIAATFCALHFGTLPSWLLIPLMMICGMIAGGIWGFIPAFFRARFKTNETIFTLMLNYVALKIITYLQYGPWRDPAAMGFPKIASFPPSAVLPKVLGVHCGWIIALVTAVIMYIFMKHSKKGYEISVVGESENTARYAGMNVGRVIMFTMVISGTMAGLAGVVQASAVSKTLSVELSSGIGYTAIITAWLSGLSAPVMVIVCFLFAAMIQGADYIQMAYEIPQAAADILQSIILFFVLGSEFFIRYRLIIRQPKKQETKEVRHAD